MSKQLILPIIALLSFFSASSMHLFDKERFDYNELRPLPKKQLPPLPPIKFSDKPEDAWDVNSRHAYLKTKELLKNIAAVVVNPKDLEKNGIHVYFSFNTGTSSREGWPLVVSFNENSFFEANFAWGTIIPTQKFENLWAADKDAPTKAINMLGLIDNKFYTMVPAELPLQGGPYVISKINGQNLNPVPKLSPLSDKTYPREWCRLAVYDEVLNAIEQTSAIAELITSYDNVDERVEKR